VSAPMESPAGVGVAATDPEVRREIVETVRRFVAREVTPVATQLEHEDRFPAEIVEQMR
jgi:alkylation response protein AidB-like acyl-CoA dehydrogenase